MMITTNQRRSTSAAKNVGDTLAEAETLLKQAATETGERAKDLRSQVGALLSSAQDKLRDLSDEAMDRAKAAAKLTDDYVYKNPWQAIGVGTAIGFLAGVLLARR